MDRTTPPNFSGISPLPRPSPPPPRRNSARSSILRLISSFVLWLAGKLLGYQATRGLIAPGQAYRGFSVPALFFLLLYCVLFLHLKIKCSERKVEKAKYRSRATYFLLTGFTCRGLQERYRQFVVHVIRRRRLETTLGNVLSYLFSDPCNQHLSV